MKEALLHIDKAINVLRRSSGPPAVISILESAHANLMHDIFGASLAADWPTLADMREAVATYTARAAEKLRRQHLTTATE
jgi:hypothetical protein